MTITYKKLDEIPKKNCYEIEFTFEHGDADYSNTYSVFFNDMTELQLIAYVKKANEISEQIEHSRSSGATLPKHFEDTCKSDSFYIPVEEDSYAKMHMSNYYASSGISQIFYYNEHSEKYEVKIS